MLVFQPADAGPHSIAATNTTTITAAMTHSLPLHHPSRAPKQLRFTQTVRGDPVHILQQPLVSAEQALSLGIRVCECECQCAWENGTLPVSLVVLHQCQTNKEVPAASSTWCPHVSSPMAPVAVASLRRPGSCAHQLPVIHLKC